jgi:chromate transport protein ChrA
MGHLNGDIGSSELNLDKINHVLLVFITFYCDLFVSPLLKVLLSRLHSNLLVLLSNLIWRLQEQQVKELISLTWFTFSLVLTLNRYQVSV